MIARMMRTNINTSFFSSNGVNFSFYEKGYAETGSAVSSQYRQSQSQKALRHPVTDFFHRSFQVFHNISITHLFIEIGGED